ncbi:LuxR family transcriptional regulator, partial [Salmonella enterica subsp. enterica serovar Heidelberg]|nr:LuxR family transcriptional regulator [Salmonella enterica subsp. enterica serovar Heidelberg]
SHTIQDFLICSKRALPQPMFMHSLP